MLKNITKFFFKREAPVIEAETKPEIKATKKVEMSKWYRENEPPVVHFKINNTNDFKDCIGTLCQKHLNHLKVNTVLSDDGVNYINIPVCTPEDQIKITETHRYTTDARKVTCSACINRLKSNK